MVTYIILLTQAHLKKCSTLLSILLTLIFHNAKTGISISNMQVTFIMCENKPQVACVGLSMEGPVGRDVYIC